MYAGSGGRCPAARRLKLLASLVLVVGVVALLFLVVFPVVEVHLPNAQVTVDK